MQCSKVVICNRSRANGHEFNGCSGNETAMQNCPEWRTVAALERITNISTRKC